MKAQRCFLSLFLSLIFSLPNCTAGTLAQIHVFLGAGNHVGDLDLELFDKDKPVTVNNFVRLAQVGAYQNSFFHRCLPGAVMQGGGFFILSAFSTNIMGPSTYTNVGAVPNFGNIVSELNTAKLYSNTNKTIAMARAASLDSANSQFFLNLADNSAAFDTTNNGGGYTVFGHVVRDTNSLLGLFRSLGPPSTGFVDLTKIYGTGGINPLFASLPDILISTNAPPYNDLIYFSVSVLSARVTATTNGSRKVTWTSIQGVTNNVEFTTNVTSGWQVLGGIVGTGNSITLTDSATNNSRGYYRIHVLY